MEKMTTPPTLGQYLAYCAQKGDYDGATLRAMKVRYVDLVSEFFRTREVLTDEIDEDPPAESELP